ncbi:MAG: MarR family transcriptional regulator [Desulfocucumaceae bacterium]
MSSAIRDLREIVREEMYMKDVILRVLVVGPKTVPEIASAIGYPTYEVLIWVMGLRRYGHVSEIGDVTDEGYYRYRAAAGEGL